MAYVTGLRQLHRDLRRLDPVLQRELRVALRAVGDRLASEVRARIPVGPGVGGHVRSSVRGGANTREAWIQAGSSRYPYYPWLDFGGTAGPNKRIRRKVIKGGRYLYPVIGRHRERLFDEARKVIAETLDKVDL